MDSNNYTLSDIAAVANGNRNNGDDMFGGNGLGWLVWFVLIAMLGGGYGFGGGFGGFGGGAGLQGMATRADINEGFALNNLQSGIAAVQQGICDSTYALNNSINGGFHSLERQLADCCCGTQRAIDGVNFNMAKGFCDLNNVINNSTRDVLENANNNTRAILDFLTNDKIESLRAENQALKFQASQTAQNAFITANQEAQTAELIRRLGADCPTPAYVVQPPTPVTFPVNNCGCGCGNSYGYGYAG